MPQLKLFYPAKVVHILDEIQIFRVRFPPKPSQTHQVEKLGLTDLAYAIALVTLGLTEFTRFGSKTASVSPSLKIGGSEMLSVEN